ncbi:MAG: toprim domain-containing protein [Candidatus Avoscillospira sp.]
MIKLKEALVVEGKYDKNKLKQLVDAPVFTTEGFGVMGDKAMLGFLRTVAETRGLIILTDSDGAGFVIRNYLKGALPKDKVKHAYIPDIPGKERRKAAPGKEGKLGVEGMEPEVLLEALRRADATLEGETPSEPRTPITKTDLFDLGLTGGPDSKARRLALLKQLNLPEHMSANAMLEALNILYDREEFLEAFAPK